MAETAELRWPLSNGVLMIVAQGKWLAVLEQGSANATNAELDALAKVLDVPRDLLIDE